MKCACIHKCYKLSKESKGREGERERERAQRRKKKLTLYESGEHLAPGLQEGVSDDDLEELLEAGATAFDDVVGEAVGEDLAGERGDGDAGALALEDVAEVLEVAVAPAHAALAQLEGGDVGAAHDLVVGVHVPRRPVRPRLPHLDLQEVLRRPVDLVERLVPRVRHRLHYRPRHARHAR